MPELQAFPQPLGRRNSEEDVGKALDPFLPGFVRLAIS